MSTAERLQHLHDDAVKAAQRWEAATPGTATEFALWESWQRKEAAFKRTLRRAIGDA